MHPQINGGQSVADATKDLEQNLQVMQKPCIIKPNTFSHQLLGVDYVDLVICAVERMMTV
jgi:hypothetical protein